MLSIQHSTNTDAAVRYFRENLAQADYYCDKTAIIGKWHGKLADHLGIKGEVKAKDFEQLLYNKEPVTGAKLTARNSANRRPLYDCTFSSCKSASIALAITGDQDILKAHQRAVKDAMIALETDLQTQMGTGKYKHYETTGQGVWAEFVHEFSRPLKKEINGKTAYIPDPQLHSHCTLINATYHEEQKRFRAVEMSNVKRMAPFYESIYHSAYGQYLKEAGYELEKRGKRWELKCISRETIEKYSGRTLEIEALAKRRGIKSAKAKAALGRLTRNDKHQSLSDNQLPGHWKERLSLSEYHAIINAKGKSGRSDDKGSKGTDQVTAQRAVDLSLNHYLERNSSIQEKRALAYAIDLTSGILTPDKIIKELNSRNNIIRADYRMVSHITTREMLQNEEALIEKATAGRNTKAALNPDYEITNELLNKGQRAAIDYVLNSQDQVMMVAGDAGVGKTTLFQSVKEGIEVGGKAFFAFAPSSDASRGVLRSKGFEGADTIAKLLQNPEMQSQLRNNVALIDEAGLVPVPTMNELFDIAKEQNARLILSGDYKQHSPVQAGDALKLLEQQSQLPVARVNEIVRQKETAKHKAVIEKLARGIGLKNKPEARKNEVEQAFDTLDKNGNIIEEGIQEDRQKRIAEDYLKQVQKKDNDVFVVAPTNKEKQQITDAIRNILKENGKLGEAEKEFLRLQDKQLTTAQKELPESYLKDNVIQFHKSVPGFKAGRQYNISEITDKGEVLLQSGFDNELSPLPRDKSELYSVYSREKIALAENDKIRITKNTRSLAGSELMNGQLYDVQGFDQSGNIKLSNGQILDKNAKHIDYGFVSTSFKAQGHDAKTVLIAQSADSYGASNDRQFYTSLSRASEQCRIYTDDKIALRQAISRSGDAFSAHKINELSTTSSQTTKEQQRIDYMSRVKSFYEDRIKPSLENIKSNYEQRGVEKEIRNRDYGIDRG